MKKVIITLTAMFLLLCFCKAQHSRAVPADTVGLLSAPISDKRLDTLPIWKSNEHKLTEDQIDSISDSDPQFLREPFFDTTKKVINLKKLRHTYKCYTDKQGVKYPVYINVSDRLFIVLTNGKGQYKKYIF